MEKLKTLTVSELIAQLQKMPQDNEVRVWLPGTTIALSSAFSYGTHGTRIEGNIDPGSALDTEPSQATTITPEDLAQKIIDRANAGYQTIETSGYPPYKMAPWEDRPVWAKYIQKCAADVITEAVGLGLTIEPRQ